MDVRQAPDEISALEEDAIAMSDRIFPFRQACETAIGDGFVGPWPQALSGLQLERLGGKTTDEFPPAPSPANVWNATL